MPETRVLLVGPRRGLLRALRRRGLPFAVWREPASRGRAADAAVVAEFPRTREAVARVLGSLRDASPFSHVIAGTEAAVVCAAHARRILGARAAPFTVALRCRDKLEMKRWLHGQGIPMTDFLDGAEARAPEEVFARLGRPVVDKDRRGSGGRRLRLVQEPGELGPPTRDRILERFVDARELSVESFVQHGEVLFESITEYRRKAELNVVPGGYDEATRAAVLELSRRVVRALDVHWGITHLEMYLTASGPIFGEIALRPPGGYIVDLIGKAYGFDAWDAIVGLELELPVSFPSGVRAHTAAWLIHPGPGTVGQVEGLERIERIPGVDELRFRVSEGDVVAAREGAGQEVGHILFRAPDPAALAEALEQARQTLRIELREDEGGASGIGSPPTADA